jgi:hypothetical protein
VHTKSFSQLAVLGLDVTLRRQCSKEAETEIQTSKMMMITTFPFPESCARKASVCCFSCFSLSSRADHANIAVARSPSYPSMSAYLPALVRTSTIFTEAGSPSPSPTKASETSKQDLPMWQKSKSRRRKSYGDESRAPAASNHDPRHQTLPAIISDIFNPS